MKLWLYALAMCQSMFCAIPFPWNLWDEKARDRMLLCLPFIGLEIGAIWWGAAALCRMAGLPGPLAAMVTAAVPYFLTGFLHLDGFMDVTDAVRSYRSLERRREILKDSHVGSFAVIGVVMLILCQYAAAGCLESSDLRVLVLIPAASRCCSVLAIQFLPPMQTSQYSNRTKQPVLPAVTLALLLAAAVWMGSHAAIVMAAELAGYALALRRAYKSLEGMNGDISGYSLTLAELAALAAMAIVQ